MRGIGFLNTSARRRHAVIVDDERLARRELRSLLEEAHAEQVHIVGEAASVSDAARLVEATHADLVFLDITLAQESGFDLLPRLGAGVDVVFVTAHDAYACFRPVAVAGALTQAGRR